MPIKNKWHSFIVRIVDSLFRDDMHCLQCSWIYTSKARNLEYFRTSHYEFEFRMLISSLHHGSCMIMEGWWQYNQIISKCANNILPLPLHWASSPQFLLFSVLHIERCTADAYACALNQLLLINTHHATSHWLTIHHLPYKESFWSRIDWLKHCND